jgi:hypothetical protein
MKIFGLIIILFFSMLSYGNNINEIFKNPIRVDSIIISDNEQSVKKTITYNIIDSTIQIVTNILSYYTNNLIFDNKQTFSFGENYVKRYYHYPDDGQHLDSIIYNQGKVQEWTTTVLITGPDNNGRNKKISYFYNENGKIDRITQNENNIVIEEKFIYNANNKLIEYNEIYSLDNGLNIDTNKIFYNYIDDKNIELLFGKYNKYKWENNLSFIWGKETHIYEEGRLIKKIIYANISAENEPWIEAEKTEYIYDSLMPSFKISEFIDYPATEIIHYSWNDETNKWDLNKRNKLYYSKHDGNVKSANIPLESIAKIYPNPTTGIINFDFKNNYSSFNFELSDINGRFLMKETLTTNKQINFENYPKGIYLYRIYVGNNIYTGKVIKN